MRSGFSSLIAVALALLAIATVSTAEDPAAESKALIIVDIQEFYFEDGFMPLVGSVEAAQSAQRVLEYFRANGWPVVHVQHLPDGTDTPGQDVQPAAFRIRKEVEPKTGEVVIGKHHPNSFRETSLQDELTKLDVDQLVIVGMQTHMCLEAATRAAADFGYQVTVVGDACATRDLEYGGSTVPAAQVHASTLASINGAYATVVSSEEFLKAAE
jgi:nicotinamidase-related amidase